MSLPYYKRYTRDFLDGTVGMSLELKGAYSIIIDLIFHHGGKLFDDPQYVAGQLGCSVRKWNMLRKQLVELDKIYIENGIISNLRADKEQIILSKYRDNQKINASGALKNKGKVRAAATTDINTDTEPDSNTHTHTARARSNLGGLPMRVYACWNQMAEQHGLHKIDTANPNFGRGKLIMTAVNEYLSGREELLFEAIMNVPLNPHWIGQTEANFRARLPWLLKDPERINQALELTPNPMEPSHAKTRHSDKRSSSTDAGQKRSDVNDRAAIGAMELLHSKGIV